GPAYGLLFELTNAVLDPILVSKLLAFPLLLASAYYLFRIGEEIRGSRLGMALALVFTVMNLASPATTSVIGGLRRSFALPLLFALIYYLMKRQDWKAAIVIFFSGVIYPPVFVLGTVTYGLSLFERSSTRSRFRVNLRRAVPLVFAIGLVGVSMLPQVKRTVRTTAAAVTVEPGAATAVVDNPIYQVEGRHTLFSMYPVLGLGGLTEGSANLVYIVVMAAMAVIIIRLDKSTLITFPTTLKQVIFAGLICFAAAWIGLIATSSLLLYYPSRYTQASLLAFLTIFVVTYIPQGMRQAVEWQRQNGKKLIGLVVIVSTLVIVLALNLPESSALTQTLGLSVARALLISLSLLLLALTIVVIRRNQLPGEENRVVWDQSITGWKRIIAIGTVVFGAALFISLLKAPFYVASNQERELFAFIEQLPPDSTIGGHPCSLDSIPLFAKRSVLYNCESPLKESGSVMAMLNAFYASELQEVLDFCDAYEVDYMVVDSRFYDPQYLESGTIFFEPYNSQLAPMLKNRREFALDDVSSSAIEFAVDSVTVVSCNESLQVR
ncbi:MAG: hypothetical protein WA996_02830, partial [Candidatus Promineifilaceae bacterium]